MYNKYYINITKLLNIELMHYYVTIIHLKNR